MALISVTISGNAAPLKKSVDESEGLLGRLGGSFTKFGAIAAAGMGAAAAGIGFAAKAAADDEKSFEQLAVTLRNVTGATDEMIRAVDEQLGAMSLATGVADDKVIYAYVPKLIRYYLGEDAIIPNVPTFVCGEEKQCEHVLAKLGEFVVKPADASGGYGIVLGPRATKEQLEECRARIKANPRNYIAQPMLSLSRVPTVVGDSLEGRHVDLRPFILYGEEIFVLPGGLTRVALVKGSLVVNSSQGGGSKDTWVVHPGRA